MATQMIYRCDRCGKLLDNSSSYTKGIVKIQRRSCLRIAFRDSVNDVWNGDVHEFELCAECRDKLYEFLRGEGGAE